MKTTAAILLELNAPLAIEELELPRLDAGQVLVAIICTGICGSQIGEIRGAKGPDRWLPHLLGHEACARVLEIGPGVRHVAEGDKVVLHWRPGAGIQAAPPAYQHPKLGRVNAGWVTTFQTHSIVSENRMTRIPEEADAEIASLMGCAVTTGFGVVANDANLRLGESIVIWGTGGVGLSAVLGARLSGAQPIVAVDLCDKKLALARQFGADLTINAMDLSADEVAAKIRAHLPDGADAIIENTGLPPVIAAAYGLAARRGIVVLVGVPKAGAETSVYTLPLHFGKRLTGSEGGGTVPPRDIPRYLALQDRNRLDYRPMITDHFVLTEINDAITALMHGQIIGRPIVRPS